MPRPRCRPAVGDTDYQDVAEDLWMDLRAHERGFIAVNPARPGGTRMLGEHGPYLRLKITEPDKQM